MIIIIFYLITRLINLTLLPIFTDETNYLDWGWREIHTSGRFFYSLYDAKQPLVMWFFGIFQSFTSDPLLAGRLVSVLTGLLTLVGLYKISKNPLVPILYTLSPIFLFFDRQALMESSLVAAGVWTAYFLIKFIHSPTFKTSLPLGLVLGLSLYIKSNALLFSVSAFVVIALAAIKNPKFRFSYLTLSFVILIFTFLVTSPMLLQPSFWKYIHLSTQYSPSLSQAANPRLWFQNTFNILDISFWQLTPLVFISAVLGIRRQIKTHGYLLIFLAIPLILEVFIAKFIVNRYVVPFLPLLLIFAADFLSRHKTLFFVSLLTTLIPAAVQITNPALYLKSLSRVSPNSYYGGYVTAEASGYNAMSGLKFFEKLSQKEPLVLAIGLWSGNPELAYLVYFRHHPKIKVVILDSRLLDTDLDQYNCISYPQPIYYLSRENRTAGLDKFFKPYAQITTPVNSTVSYVFKLISPCTGPALTPTLDVGY